MHNNKYGRAVLWLGDTFNRNVGFILILTVIFFGFAILNLQQDNQKLLKDTQATVKNTETIVQKQDETLDAIAQLAVDNKLTSKQLGDTIICMLLIPVGQRTTDTQEQCRTQAVMQTSDTSSPVAQASPQRSSTSTSTPAPQPSQNQENTSQEPENQGLLGLVPDDVPILGPLL